MLPMATPAPLPALGLRNYWYPVIAGCRLRRRTKPVRILGEDSRPAAE
jgi:hypothetical protein